MKVVLLRHATRSLREMEDPGLTADGHAQANGLARRVIDTSDLPKPKRLIASPKRRAIETLRPLHFLADVPLHVDGRLDERQPHESGHTFEGRILEVINDLSDMEESYAEDDAVYLCSHLDWLEAILPLLPSDLSDFEIQASWSTCQYRIFTVKEGIWSLESHGHVAVPAK